MCGRYTLKRLDAKAFKRRYTIELPEFEDALDIRPTHQVLVCAEPGRAEWMRWGLLPSWGADLKAKPQPINAMGESVHEKPMFKRLLGQRRCLIFASTFYEWRAVEGSKKKQRMEISTPEPVAFAGLWDVWHPREEAVRSCVIITTAANELVRTLHSRMPVILEPEAANAWLDPAATTESLAQLLAPRAPDGMRIAPADEPVAIA